VFYTHDTESVRFNKEIQQGFNKTANLE
jgi:hypothetical protein